MALPREWEHGDGVVPALVPLREMVIGAHKGQVDRKTYRDTFTTPRMKGSYEGWSLRPGELCAVPNDAPWDTLMVASGDTLCCACGTEKAAQNRCHRTLSSALLSLFGWEVVLDGKPFPSERAMEILAGSPLWAPRLEPESSALALFGDP